MSAPTTPFRLTGFHVLGGIVAFFAVIIAVDVTFATLAYRTFSGQVADNPYEAGLLFNRTLAQRRAEAALGWEAHAQAGAGRLVLTFADRAGAPLETLSVHAELSRPATEKGRRTLVLVPQGGGAYAAAIGNLRGVWDVRGVARARGGEAFEVQSRVVLP